MTKNIIIILLVFSLVLTSCTSTNNAPIVGGTSQGFAATISPTPTATPTPAARVALAETEMRNGDYDAAMTEFETAQYATDLEVAADALLGIGRVFLLRQNYDDAARQFGWLINTVPAGDQRTKAYFFLAKSYEGLSAWQQAADAYQGYLDAVGVTPIKGDILEMQGDDLVSAGNNTKALEVYKNALAAARPEYQEELQLKVAEATAASGDTTTALTLYQSLYDQTSNYDTKSTINLYMGRIYLAQGDSASAYARFQLSVDGGFVTSGDTYSQTVALVNAGQTVNELMRGEIDYYAGQYGMAVAAFDRYMAATPNHDDTPLYFKALSLYNMGDYAGEVTTWNELIQNFRGGTHYAQAFLEKATTQMNHLSQYDTAAQTLLTFVAAAPDSASAGSYLYQAARIYEVNNQLELAAQTWERVINEYPSDENAILSQFEAGICYFRLGRYSDAQVTFQKNAMLTSIASDKARAEMWIGKSLEAQNKHNDAILYYKQAVAADPTGYYSIRAQEILNGQPPFPSKATTNLGVDWLKEEKLADSWMRDKFNISPDVDLNPSNELTANVLYQRGDAFWQLGMLSKASSEFESLRQELQNDPLNTYRLMKHMVDLGINYTAVYSARQVLDLTGLDQSSFLDSAPAYFNHIRFGSYFSDLILPEANADGIDPLLIFSLVRLESVFEPEIVSSWGAIGLMQVTPDTGVEINTNLAWPPNYTVQDLYRPVVNIKFGTHYFSKWYSYFGNDVYAALAAYNGGIGNAMTWKNLSGNDPDLFLEVIRASETRDYIRYITEYYDIYQRLYTGKQ